MGAGTMVTERSGESGQTAWESGRPPESWGRMVNSAGTPAAADVTPPPAAAAAAAADGEPDADGGGRETEG